MLKRVDVGMSMFVICFYSQFVGAVKQSIMINHIQNKHFCLNTVNIFNTFTFIYFMLCILYYVRFYIKYINTSSFS